MSQQLPTQFAEFEKFVAVWSLTSERARHSTRLTVEFEQLKSLYEAVLPRLEEIASHLNKFPMDGLPEPQQHLLNLALSCMEVALPVEAHGQTTVPGGFDPARFQVDF